MEEELKKLILLAILAVAPLSANAGVIKFAVKHVVVPVAKAAPKVAVKVAKVAYKVVY